MSATERREVERSYIQDRSSITPCSIIVNGTSNEITLIDISGKGAKIKGVQLDTDQSINLKLADGTERKSEVVWTLGDISGLMFVD